MLQVQERSFSGLSFTKGIVFKEEKKKIFWVGLVLVLLKMEFPDI